MKARTPLAALLATLAVAAPASAQEISVQSGVLRITGDVYVNLDAVGSGSEFSVTDWAGSLEPGDGCELDSPDLPAVPQFADRTMTCTGVTASVHATLSGTGDGEDIGNFVSVTTPLPVKMEGGPGTDFLRAHGSGPAELAGNGGWDNLRGGEGADVLDGGADDDMIEDGLGSDRVIGGPGHDILMGDAACCGDSPDQPGPAATGTPDVYDGGAGADTFENVEPADRVTGGEGRDRVALYRSGGPVSVVLGAGGYDVEGAEVFEGDATVRGDGRFNEIRTGRGKDTIDPGAGVDIVESGEGDDSINVRDGLTDLVECGDGADSVVADAHDEVESSCESVDRAGGPAAGAPVAATPAAAIVPAGLKLTSRRRGRFTIVKGRLLLPAGASPKLCDGGGITVRVGRRRAGTVLGARCTFTARLKGRGKVKASFAGTPALAPFSR